MLSWLSATAETYSSLDDYSFNLQMLIRITDLRPKKSQDGLTLSIYN